MNERDLDYLAKCERDGTRAALQQITDKAIELLHLSLRLRDEKELLLKSHK